MKTIKFPLIPMAIVICMVIFSFSYGLTAKTGTGKELPAGVKAAIDKSCYGCHNSVSGNQKATEKLDFKSLDSLSRAQKIAKYKAISETIKNGEMPPKRFLDKNPDRKLTTDEAKSITNWYSGEIKELLKK